MNKNLNFSQKDLKILNSPAGILDLLRSEQPDFHDTLRFLKERELINELQVEMLKLQSWVKETGYRLLIVFEGRDLAGKGGCIRWFVEHLNPRSYRTVALPKPTTIEKGQWYFQRYIRRLPNPGEIILFDRSWYNRAVVEPVNDLCSIEEYNLFMSQVPGFERMLVDDGIHIIKFWLEISKDAQKERINRLESDALDSWKLSGLDRNALKLWDKYSEYINHMIASTNMDSSPWVKVMADYAPSARVEAIKHVLRMVNYEPKVTGDPLLEPRTDIIKPILAISSDGPLL